MNASEFICVATFLSIIFKFLSQEKKLQSSFVGEIFKCTYFDFPSDSIFTLTTTHLIRRVFLPRGVSLSRSSPRANVGSKMELTIKRSLFLCWMLHTMWFYFLKVIDGQANSFRENKSLANFLGWVYQSIVGQLGSEAPWQDKYKSYFRANTRVVLNPFSHLFRW